MSRLQILTVIFAAASSAIAAASPAAAETWKADSILVPERSAGSCDRGGFIYSFDYDGAKLHVANVNGNMGTSTVDAGGAVSLSFKSPSGASLTVSGNALTKELTVDNYNFGCTWRLVPRS